MCDIEENNDLKNKVVLVTGGGSGIGAGICVEFAREGASLIVTDINRKNAEQTLEQITNISPESSAMELDVTSSTMVDKVAEEVVAKYGKIDVWVNCAGVSYITPFLKCTEDIWNKTIDINLKGTFNCCKSATRQMLLNKCGSIINMSSQSGKTGNSHFAAYCASKFGVIGLTQSLAMEFARDNIRVNTLCPGVVFTPMWDDMINDYAAKRNMKPEDVKPYFESKIPMGRISEMEDVTKAAVFLASDNSSYITGQSLNICGGTVMH